MEQKYYKCSVCGKIIAVVKDTPVPVMCCGKKMEEIIPGTVDAAVEKHVPVITKVDDTTISTMEDLTAVKKQYSAGDTVTFTVYRQGETITLSLTWDATPADTAANENQDQTVQDNSQYGGYDPYDLFDYFFGGGR